MECSTFTASSFRILNNSAAIPSLPLALFILCVFWPPFVIPEWATDLPHFLQFKSEFGNKEFMIRATVSPWSSHVLLFLHRDLIFPLTLKKKILLIIYFWLHRKMLTLSTLDPAHAVLVNKFWYFGGNERSRRFIERCIQTFPSSCLLGPEGTPVSWVLMDQTGELRMAGTLPEYRARGLISYLACVYVHTVEKLGFPLYSHVDKANHIMQRVCSNMQNIFVPHGWNQWNFVPL
ncbi:hypothetical protein FD754_023631 [Muntiacus muntjak]|uniref:Glycine N-acyltransferase-like protein n=1 Tax=Muntiacus muntjak TaxID=9888 RepID=A0A5N3UST6_MUNMU|nr:hypothetical protein FD754_023633 [Muntiacus muntjak]KAB0339819.1 hypothetical protein FD754_023631 [Muntiacus muntjak]